ncbi:formylglycine-generating enzyme family protein [uncultured Desulfosarcina sp.]|uniref:formylglycine-generating enzyme family protein n=1 Tax=uncultured Desulfosarcina sp. TaxID=218289 RepID=UPI0029C7B82B|nr:formylglycine-generating enzyme family protein [uncultured Desulfosarcina sp.]
MIFLCRGTAWLLGVLVALSMVLDGPLSAAAQERVVENRLGMTFVLIPAGTFVMGSPIEEAHRDISEVQHQVTLGKPFYLQRTEVTVDQWRAVMGRRWLARKRGTGDMPVVKVSWHDCQKFIRKLNRLTGGQYRLPTEAQWEYAARAGSSTAYFWGNQIDCSRAMYANNPMKHDDCVGAFPRAEMKPGQPAPAGSFVPNAWGLYDMHGNVWEWCEDLFDRYETVSTVDPCETESGKDRVRRGGSWFSSGPACRSANRAYAHPMSRLQNTGFRLVMVPPDRNGASSDSQ